MVAAPYSITSCLFKFFGFTISGSNALKAKIKIVSGYVMRCLYCNSLSRIYSKFLYYMGHLVRKILLLLKYLLYCKVRLYFFLLFHRYFIEGKTIIHFTVFLLVEKGRLQFLPSLIILFHLYPF